VGQLRPDNSYVRFILGAVYDIRICEEIFDGWATQLDKCVQLLLYYILVLSFDHSQNAKTLFLGRACVPFTFFFFYRVCSEKPDERERTLRHHLVSLKENASWCSHATNAILLCHARFAYLMARRIDGASKSWLKGLRYGTDTTRLANDIAGASRALAQHVAQMRDDLASFVGALEKTEVVKRERPSTGARRIFGWLKYLFSALSSVFALGSFISPLLNSIAPGVGVIAPAASALWEAAAAFCGAVAGTSFSLGMHAIPPPLLRREANSDDQRSLFLSFSM
jgi:hypothetical protein